MTGADVRSWNSSARFGTSLETKPAIPKAFFSGFQGVRAIESSTILERAMGIEPIAARG
jgi:hypothetical protein